MVYGLWSFVLGRSSAVDSTYSVDSVSYLFMTTQRHSLPPATEPSVPAQVRTQGIGGPGQARYDYTSASKIAAIEHTDAAIWDQLVAGHPQGHLLQSWNWGELKGQFGWRPLRL